MFYYWISIGRWLPGQWIDILVFGFCCIGSCLLCILYSIWSEKQTIRNPNISWLSDDKYIDFAMYSDIWTCIDSQLVTFNELTKKWHYMRYIYNYHQLFNVLLHAFSTTYSMFWQNLFVYFIPHIKKWFKILK